MTIDRIHDKMELLRRALPDLDYAAVNRALMEIHYMEVRPEDMIKGRTSWDDLYDTVCTLQYGFEALYSVVRRVAEDRTKGCVTID